MFVVLPVTGITVRGRSNEHIVLVTGFACHFCVLTFEFKCREIVIELCRRPAVFVVTVRATEPVTALMRFVIMMTGIAIL